MRKSYKERSSECKALVEKRLNEIFDEYKGVKQKTVLDAMKYSVLNGGKRVRAFLLMETAQALGCSDDKSVDVACCVEMVHAYSLIHDDLPCMDNDDFRRGLPSCHKKFGEAVAVLAGDGLQTMAFEMLSGGKITESFGAERALRMINILSNGIGENGMLGGQTLDIEFEGKAMDKDVHMLMVEMKTAALLASASILGCICAGREDLIPVIKEFSVNLGIAFQIKDDILDVVGNEEAVGKTLGKDIEEGKNTFTVIYGLQRAEELCSTYHKKALDALNNADFDTAALVDATKFLSGRSY